jgi:hypothetical protein
MKSLSLPRLSWDKQMTEIPQAKFPIQSSKRTLIHLENKTLPLSKEDHHKKEKLLSSLT